MNRKVLLMILDGWGCGAADRSNAIHTAGTPQLDALRTKYPNAQLLTCGEDVGLPAGQMGNSEVGHLNIGAGRIVYQDLVKINRACEDKSLYDNKALQACFLNALKNKKKVHLMGLLSDGGVHSSLDHLYALCDYADKFPELWDNVFVHCFLDGRDTDPHSGIRFVEQLTERLRRKNRCTKIGTLMGRYYAMDRDQRWERIAQAYHALVHNKGRVAPNDDATLAMQEAYDNGETDEFIKPYIVSPFGKVEEGDSVIFFNFRNDRARELTIALTQKDFTEPELNMHRLRLHYCTMTPYDDKFSGLHILFDKENVGSTLGEVLSNSGKTQLRIAETEKYAHVTFFFSGGREAPFPQEERILVPSPKVATYDLQPQMSAFAVKDAIIAELNKGKYDFIALNFANGDMVGHTGVYEAICSAVRTIDTCVGEIVPAATANGYSVIIIADHGNADYALNPDGTPNTAHSLNPVPIIVVDKDIRQVQNGVLADLAPTILSMMNLPIPPAMTGNILTQS